MIKQLSDFSKAVLYYLLAIGFATVVSVLVMVLHNPNLLGFVMFAPLLAVLLMLLVITPDGYHRAAWQALGLQQAGLGSWPLAILLPLVLLGASFELTTLVGAAHWQLPADTTWAQFLLNWLPELLVGTLFALGEEIGWRGYLLPKLKHLGAVRAALLGGLLHGLWHLPMILLTPFYHHEGNRWIVIPLFLLMLTLGGVFYSYLRLTSNALWPVAIGHGAFNTFWSMFAALAVPTSPLWMEYLSGESGVITLLLAMLAVAWLLQRLPKHTNAPILLQAKQPVGADQHLLRMAPLGRHQTQFASEEIQSK